MISLKSTALTVFRYVIFVVDNYIKSDKDRQIAIGNLDGKDKPDGKKRYIANKL